MRREVLLPLIVACALFVENMDSTVLATALPAIAQDLGTEPIALKLALTSYLLGLAVFIPVSGWIADRFGARPTFVAAICVYLFGSLCCAAGGSLGELVAARLVQGAGGAMMVPVGRLVILRSVPKAQLVQAMAWLTIPALVGPVMGPPLGGLIATYAHWRWIFLINLPIGLVGIVLAWRFMPDLRDAQPRPLDVAGFLLSGLGLGLTIFGFSSFGGHLWSNEVALMVLLVGVALLIGYALHARRHAHPLIDLGLFRLTTFRIGVLGGSLFRIGVGATPLLLPLMLQLGFGLTPLQSGSITFVSAAGAMFMKTLTARIFRRFGFRATLVGSALVAALLLGLQGWFQPDWSYPLMLSILLLGGCFRSLQFTGLNALSYDEVGNARMSQATSLSSMMQQLSLSLGVALGAFALGLSGFFTGTDSTELINFRFAFMAMAGIALLSLLFLLRLPFNAGHELAGRPAVEAQVRPQQEAAGAG